MSNRNADLLATLLDTRAPKRTVIRGVLGDGQGTVEHPTLSDTVYVRLRDSTSTVAIARNLTVPALNDVNVDVERTVDHSKTLYSIIGLTKGISLPANQNPHRAVVLHGDVHSPQSYDPITGAAFPTSFPTTDYLVKNDDMYIGVGGTLSARRYVRLPLAADVDGQLFIVKDETGTAGNVAGIDIEVDTQNSEQIDSGGTSFNITTNYGALTFLADGTNNAWHIISGDASIIVPPSPPINAQYLVLTNDATLTAERQFVAGAGLTGTDAGANSTYTVDVVTADTSLTISANSMQVRLATNSGLQVSSGLQLGTPSSVTSSSTNAVSAATHSHAIDATIVTSARTITAGAGLTGGGDLSANRTIDVATADTSMTINADSIQVRLATNSGLQVSSGLQLGTPTTLTVATTNSVTSATHSHAITSSSNPGAAASILASDASGYLVLQRLGIGVSPSYLLHAKDATAPTIRLDNGGAATPVTYFQLYRSDADAGIVGHSFGGGGSTGLKLGTTRSDGMIAFYTGTDLTFSTGERVRIDSSGRVGIGMTPTATLDITQAVSASGSPNALRLAGGAHTTLTASTEAIDVNVNLARTVQFATGALATQRAVVFQAPTYGFVGASTLTTAATVAITAAPVAGTNATLTNTYALWVQAGNVRIDALTQGYVVYPGASGVLSGESNFFWDATNHRLGIGTSSPSRTLHVIGAAPLRFGQASDYFEFIQQNTNLWAWLSSAGNYIMSWDGANFRSGFGGAFAPSATVDIQTPLATTGTPGGLWWTSGAHVTLTNAELNDVYFNAARTVGFAGGVATVAAQRTVRIAAATYAANAAGLVMTDAATVAISGAPVASTNVTFTNTASALWVQGGQTRLDGNLFINAVNILTDTTTGMKIGTATTQKIGFFNATPVVQQTDGAALTNNVTSGGTTNQIDNFTSLSVYATDAAAIRNDIYQLSRKLKIVDDALRTFGLLS